MAVRILFVDDEQNVLDGLRRMLRPMRQEWETEYVTSGSNALTLLEQKPFDVIVSDMRMPGMDGCELLGIVRERFPQLVRIVLTGQCSKEAVLRLVPLAHRHLTKPCDTETLKETVARACALRNLLTNEKLKALTARLQSIPSLPSLYMEVVNELKSPEPSLQKVGKLIAQDIGMTARIMQVVNSSFFGMRSKVVNPAQAVILLGLEMTRLLVLASNVFSRYDPNVLKPFSIDALWNHSLQISGLARRIAQAEKASEIWVEYATVAGLLHDMGLLILAAHLPEVFKDVLKRSHQENIPLWEMERTVLAATHAEVGAYLLGLWGLPEPIVEAVAWHHRPADCPGKSFSPLTAVHVAAALDQLATEAGPDQFAPGLDMDYLHRLGLAQRLDEWRSLVRHEPSP